MDSAGRACAPPPARRLGRSPSRKGYSSPRCALARCLAQDEHGIRLPAHVLACLGLEVAIQALHTTGKAAPVVLLPEQDDPKILGWPLRHSRHDPTLMLRKRPLEPLARRWWIDQRIEKDSPIPVGQNKRLMLRDRPSGGVCEHRHAEIRQLASFKLRRPLNKGFGGLVDAKPESLFSEPPVAPCYRSHSGRPAIAPREALASVARWSAGTTPTCRSRRSADC